jgi:hypothetical protein
VGGRSPLLHESTESRELRCRATLQPLAAVATSATEPFHAVAIPGIVEAIEQAIQQSPTFNQLVTAITATDGIMYVHYGECGRNALACLILAVTRPDRTAFFKSGSIPAGRDTV